MLVAVQFKLMLIARMFFYGSHQHMSWGEQNFLQHIDAIINTFVLPLVGICRISPLESSSLPQSAFPSVSLLFSLKSLHALIFPLLDVDTLDS